MIVRGPCRWRRLEARRRAARLAQLGGEPVLAAVGSAAPGPKRDLLVLPGRIERFEIVGLGIGLGAQRGQLRCVELRLGERDQRGEHRIIGRLALGEPFAQRRENVARLADELDRLGRRPRRGKLEEQRQEVGQFRGGRREAARPRRA